ncbi:beta strand repeat-containing protein [Tistrella bauzanensis]
MSGSVISTIRIAAANDAPTITTPGSGEIEVVEDVASPVTGISFADVDAAGGLVTVTLTAAGGRLAATSGAGVTVGGTEFAMTLTGSIADINAFIADSAVTYTTYLNGTSAQTLTIDIDDGGNSGEDGAKTAQATVSMTVAAVNDAPDVVGIDIDFSGSSPEQAIEVLTLDDGSYYVVGYGSAAPYTFQVARFTVDGKLDLSYGGGDGVVETTFGVSELLTDALIQPDGKLLLLGRPQSGSDPVVMTRYTTDGSLDTSFGTGGTASFALGVAGLFTRSMALDGDGDILLSGTSGSDVQLIKVTADGALDTSFGGGDGIIVQDVGGSDWGFSIAVRGDGKILIGGSSDTSASVSLFNADGSLDTSFGTNGTVLLAVTDTTAIEHIVVQPDGKIVVVGLDAGATPETSVWRLNSDGSLDAGFGSGGVVTLADRALGGFRMNDAGQIYILSERDDSGDPVSVLIRIDSDGMIDGAFGTGGERDVPGITEGQITGTAGTFDIDAQGRLVLAGVVGGSMSFTMRLDADGNPASGVVHVEDGGHTAITPSALIIDTELAAADSYEGATVTLARLGGSDAEDSFDAVAGGTLAALVEGGDVTVDGVVIGSVTTNSGGQLVITLNADATSERVNSMAQQIGYANGSDTPPASVRLTWTVDDGNTGAQGSGGALSGSLTTTVFIEATNDAPVLTLPGSGTIAVTEDVASAVTGITIADVDAAGGIVTVTFAIGAGTLTASSGSGVTVGGTDTALTLTGAITDINAFIAAEGVSYTTAGNAVGDVTLTVTVDDGGNTGTGGALGDSGTVTLDIQPVNDAPEIVDLPDAISTGDAGDGPVQPIEVITLPDGGWYVIGYDGSPYGFMVARYNADGTLDTSFDGDGGVTTDLGSSIIPVDAAIQADGKLVVMGRPEAGSGPVTLVRYNTDGSLDTSFGTDGIATTAIPGSNGQARAITIDESGDILVTGNTNNNFLLMRFDADGTLDTGFGGGDGVVDIDLGGLDWGFVITPHADGKLIVGGNSDLGGALARLNADGSLDTGFGTGGVVQLGTSGSLTTIEDVFVQSDGKVVAVGFVATVPFATTIWRLNTDGSTDTGYGTAGQFDLPATTKGDAFLTAADEVVILTTRTVGGESVSTLIRVGDDGALDTGFGTGGELQLTELADRDIRAWNIGLRADGGMVLAGPVDIATGEVFTARLDADGNFVGGVGIDDHIEGGDATAIGADIRIADVELDAADSYAGPLSPSPGMAARRPMTRSRRSPAARCRRWSKGMT